MKKIPKIKPEKKSFYDIHKLRDDILERTGLDKKYSHQVWLWLVGDENSNGTLTSLREPWEDEEYASPEEKLVVETAYAVYGDARVHVWW